MFDVGAAAFVASDPGGSLRDRAADYEFHLRTHNMPEGGVMNAYFTDTTYTTVDHFDGYADSAIWTGSALAAEAWRFMVTGSPDARSRVKAIVDTLHRSFAVTGSPGYLARYSFPTDSPLPVSFDCANTLSVHCDVPWNGRTWHWRGTTSRDQYTGVMHGYALAYDALADDEPARAIIRNDVVTVVKELMTPHPAMPVHVRVNGTEWDQTMDLENIILAPMEMNDGKVNIQINTSNYSESRLDGIREFMPDMGPALRQLPLLGWLPAVPRDGSAIMLLGMFAMALRMTDGVPGQQQNHDDIRAYYDAHKDAWFDIANAWTYARTCGGAYYSNHISLVLAYAYARAETSTADVSRFRSGVLDSMRDALGGHKNTYFDFLLEGVEAAPSPADVADDVIQLAQFQPAPRVNAPRNNLDTYAHDDQCTDLGHPMAADDAPVDVGTRVTDDFIWQRDPWRMYADGNALEVYPGVDYLAAYWSGRYHGFLPDDRPSVCSRWR